MKNNFGIILLTLILLTACGITNAQQQDFRAGKNEFTLNGKPFVVRAGEIHYSRIPRSNWDERIKMVKAMGMNTVCIYIFWNYHEATENNFNFEGDHDIAEFVRLIQKNGMYCILRPGPYVCAEWEMGGLPWWLLKKKDLQVRKKADTYFMERANKYLTEIGKQLSPYQIQRGGPIIMVQVENEYGTWDNDQQYMEKIRDYIKASGFDQVQLLRCDWSSNFFKYELDGVCNALNFGAGSNVDEQFKKFKDLKPNSPLMCGEYWTGWFDKWGAPHETRDINSFINSLKDMMDKNISFSLYMAHGGTSFGHWAGANAPAYAPTTSSYDYNAPIDESGQPTDKFFAIRNLLKNYLQQGETLAPIPDRKEAAISIPKIELNEQAFLFDNLTRPIVDSTIHPMEHYNQGWGSILYHTTIPAAKQKRILQMKDVHDYAQVYINGKLTGKADRRKGENTVEIPALSKTSQLDILVEGMGRVNYGEGIIDRKGITTEVTLTDENNEELSLKKWNVYLIPDDYRYQKKQLYSTNQKLHKQQQPKWYRGTFNIQKTGYTFLDMSGKGKGMVWVNGHNLGRYWQTGPTQTLFIPASFMRKGRNEIIVYDMFGTEIKELQALNHPILDKLVKDTSALSKTGKTLNLEGIKPIYSASLSNQSGWQVFHFEKTVTGRYICFEANSGQDKADNTASMAEIELIGANNENLSSINWKTSFADSEENDQQANGAEKLFDLQESIIWQTNIKNPGRYPHRIVIDLGSEQQISGIRLLARQDNLPKSKVKNFSIYLQKKRFIIN